MKQSSLSVVLTVYNMQECLVECLENICAQTFVDFDLICVDDGSTDSSPEILAAFAAKDSRITLLSQENEGPAKARNVGLSHAKGTYALILDADDLYEPHFFETMVERIDSTHSDVAVCRSCEFDHDSQTIYERNWIVKKEYLPPKDTFTALDMKGCVFKAFMGWAWDKIFRTSFLQSHNLSFPELVNSEDFPFVYTALLKARKIAYVDEVLIKHRIKRSGSVSNSRLKAPTCFYEGIVLQKKELEDLYPHNTEMKWGYLNWALDYTLWNINTMPQGETRTSLIASLFEGSFPALELDTHVDEFYLLYEDNVKKLNALRQEYLGKSSTKQSIWLLFSKTFRSIDELGLSQTIKRVLSFR